MVEKITLISCDNCGCELSNEKLLKRVTLTEKGNAIVPRTDMRTELCLSCLNELIRVFEKFGGE